MARNGESIGTGPETVNFKRAWVSRCRGDVRIARKRGRNAELGLSVYVGAGCLVHDLRADAVGLHRRGEGLYALDRSALRGAQTESSPPGDVSRGWGSRSSG